MPPLCPTPHTSPSCRRPTPALGYLPGLDGLRALAVIAVVLYHAEWGVPRAGFLGVEVFFVISGYIITRTLLAERAGAGRVSLAAFWLRRARRLLPALVAVLIGVTAYAALFEPSDLARIRADIPWALGYLSNWYLIFDGQPYFESFAEPSPLRHLWSLAIEEQFYLVWPLALMGGLAVMRPRRLALLLLAGALASAIAMAIAYQAGAGTSRLYYGTDTRAAGLLLGSALAFAPTVAARPARQLQILDLAGLASLGAMALLAFLLDDSSRALYQGGFLLVDVLTAMLIVAAVTPGTLTARAFSWRPLRWAGTRSYAIYLWHWPIIAFTQAGVDVSFGGWRLLALQLALTLTIAEASYWLVEQPVRNGLLGRVWRQRHRWGHLPVGERLGWIGATGGSVGALVALAAGVITFQPADTPAYFGTKGVRIGPASVRPDIVPGGASDPTPIPQTPPPKETPAAEEPTATPTMDPPTPIPAPAETPPPTSAPPTPADAPQKPADPAPPPVVTARVTAIGDSVMVGAAHELAASGEGVYVDAQVGRHVWDAIALLRQVEASGALGDVVLLHIGNNGLLRDSDFDTIMEIAGPGRRVVFVNLRVPRDWEAPNNAVIAAGVARYANASRIGTPSRRALRSFSGPTASTSRPELPGRTSRSLLPISIEPSHCLAPRHDGYLCMARPARAVAWLLEADWRNAPTRNADR